MVLAAAALAIASVGCKSSSSSSQSTATRTPIRTTPAGTRISQTPLAGTPQSTASSRTTPVSSSATVLTAQHATLGTIATDASGKTLYKSAADQPNTSNCTAACAQVWPPLAISGGTPTAGPGVTGQLGTIQRSDGTTQVTLDGSPLYTYANDTAPGDAKGDGFLGQWSAIKFSG
jgi:predicted lipoprotein with Yx(FWY)xxD motif